MEGQINVSVIIPVRTEHPMRLRMALASLTTQTYRGFEVVVVFDGNDQKGLEQLREECDHHYLRTHSSEPQIRTITLPKCVGPGAARNKGVERSIGKYIAFLDSDDMMVPQSLMWRKNLLDRNPDFHAIDSWTHCHGYKRQLVRHGFFDGYETVPTDPFRIFTSSVMIRREIFDRIPFCEEEWTKGGGEDQAWYADFFYCGFMGGTIQAPLNIRTKHSIPGGVKWPEIQWEKCRHRAIEKHGDHIWRRIFDNLNLRHREYCKVPMEHCL